MANLIIPVLYAMLQLITFFVLGFFFRKKNIFSSQFFKDTSKFIVIVGLPLYYFVRMAVVDIEGLKVALFFPFISILLTLVTMVIAFFVMAMFKIEGSHRRVGLALGSFGNTSFIPLFMIEIFPLSVPIIEQIFGVSEPLLYLGAFTIAQSPLLWGIGDYLVSGKMSRPKLKELISPPMFGIIFGLMVSGFGFSHHLKDPMLPYFHIFQSLDKVGMTIFPLTIICLGATIADMGIGENVSRKFLNKLAIAVAMVRLLLVPALFFGLYFLVKDLSFITNAMIWVIFLQMHIPPGTSLSVMAVRRGAFQTETSYAILVNYIAYLFLLPIYILLLLSLPGIG
jgi:predicted permease